MNCYNGLITIRKTMNPFNFAKAISKAKDLFLPATQTIDNKKELFNLLNDSHHHLLKASPALLDNAGVAEIVVSQIGSSLGYFSEAVKDNEDVLKKALKNDSTAIVYASPRLILDKKITLPLIQSNVNIFKLIPLEERENGTDYIAAAIDAGDRNIISKLSTEYIQDNKKLQELFILLEDKNYLNSSTNPTEQKSLNVEDLKKLINNETFKNILESSKILENFESINNNITKVESDFLNNTLKENSMLFMDIIDKFHISLGQENQAESKLKIAA